jgi:internalin A
MSELALQRIREAKEQRLTRLDLGRCGLTELPDELFELYWLEELIISGYWREYSFETKEDNSFHSKFDAEENNIKSLNPDIRKLKALRKLILREQKKIKDLSPLENLLNLEFLDISLTSVNDLSPLKNLVNLHSIIGWNINVKILTPLINLKNLKLLELPFSSIKDISPLKNLPKLEVLIIFGTNISDFSTLKYLLNLNNLNLHSTRFSDLNILKDLTKLENLIIASTQVTDLTPLKHLVKLKQLLIHNNQVKDFYQLKYFSNLEELNVSNTQISDLIPLENMIKLQKLHVGNTQISDLNPLKSLFNLNQLEISYTLVKDLFPLKKMIEKGLHVEYESDVYFYENDVSYIYVKNCPLINPPIEIVKQGNEAILKYFKEREKGATIKAREAKLLILGEGGAGKTTFVRKFKEGMKAPMPKEEESTHGIEVSPFLFPSEDETPYKVNVWDFGGQEIYHATHQFFLTKRSVYVLVTDTRKEDTDFNYWLQVIDLLSEGSPVIILQNQKGGRVQDIDFSGLQARYKNIIGIYAFDLKHDGDALEKLRKRIEDEITRLPHINQDIPASWQNLRENLEQERSEKPYISLEAYYDMAKKSDINDPDFVGQYFHDLGVFLHFQDDAILKHRIFLNNQWVISGVYKILDDIEVKNKLGRFNIEDIKRILGKSGEYSQIYHEVLRLMSKFELSYQMQDTQGEEYLAPQLLPVSEPILKEWDERQNLQLHYEYGFMPKGLLSRLIVRLNHYIKDAQGEAWRTGVVFHRRNGKALTKETFDKRMLHIQAQGADAKEILTIVSEEIDRLNNGYHNLNVKKLVPCNCGVCAFPERLKLFNKNSEPNFYEYEDLMRRKEKGKSTIECKYSYDDVNVLRLLDSVFVTTFFKPQAKKIFISYSKHDRSYLETLKKHLKPLERNELIQSWDDNKLVAGEEWEKSLQSELLTADIIVLLVSADLMATDYIWDIEMKAAIERHERGEAAVVPVIIRPCVWTDTPFARFNALPDKGKPISTYTNQDDAWAIVVERIKSLTEKL